MYILELKSRLIFFYVLNIAILKAQVDNMTLYLINLLYKEKKYRESQ